MLSSALGKYPRQFLSTPSARRATPAGWAIAAAKSISIHALREEGDPGKSFVLRGVEEFLSTPSARRATGSNLLHQLLYKISIHALREEGDLAERRDVGWAAYFYPRPPRGGRPYALFTQA